jgi:Ca-activated chloride channel homolog
MFVKLRYKEPDGATSRLLTHAVAERAGRPSTDLRFAAAVAAFGMVLRDSKHCGEFGLSDVVALARAGLGDDVEGYRAGFVSLVERAQALELVAAR